MSEISIKNKDLVLDISNSYNLRKFNIDNYEWFLDILCWTREYQKEAIKKIVYTYE